MNEQGGAGLQQFWSKWPVLCLPPALPPKAAQSVPISVQAIPLPITTSPAVAASAGQQLWESLHPETKKGTAGGGRGGKGTRTKTGMAGSATPADRYTADAAKKTGNGHAETKGSNDPIDCAECSGPLVGKRKGARFCSDTCRNNAAGRAYRERKVLNVPVSAQRAKNPDSGVLGKTAEVAVLPRRLVTDAAAVLHPHEVQRPFDTDLGDEPEWVRDELRPEPLACEG